MNAMGLKSGAAASLAESDLEDPQAAANRADAMKKILESLDKDGQLSKWMNEYSKKIQSYSSGKAVGARAAKKK